MSDLKEILSKNVVSYENHFILNPDFEIVERKGVGHPDTLSDAIAERCSFEYSQYFNNHFKKYADHWFDKVILIGGRANIDYGIGEIIDPYKIIICGKCVKRVGNIEIPLYQIFRKAVDYILNKYLTDFDATVHRIIIDETVDSHGAGRSFNRYQPQSINDLKTLSVEDKVSNDCNVLSAHYPLSDLEHCVLSIEAYLNSKKYKKEKSYVGWDIKITGIKNKKDYEMVVNVPILAKHVKNREEYDFYVNQIKIDIENYLAKDFEGKKYKLNINPQDNTGKPYLTALGSAADTGDVGVVGRGNRANGLITPMKSMSIEAASGKNPLDHTGKIYTILCQELSKRIFEKTEYCNQVHLTTYKELSILTPQQIIVQFEHQADIEYAKLLVEQIVSELFSAESMKNTITVMVSEFTSFW